MRTHIRQACRLAVLVAVIVVAVDAPASGRVAPPGNSGVAQYLEVVPSAKGPSTPDGNGHALPPATRRQLAARGAAGRKLARFADATAPASPRPGSRDTRASSPPVGADTSQHGSAPIGSTVTALFATSNVGGMGLLLPLGLIASTAVLVALALRRHRSA